MDRQKIWIRLVASVQICACATLREFLILTTESFLSKSASVPKRNTHFFWIISWKHFLATIHHTNKKFCNFCTIRLSQVSFWNLEHFNPNSSQGDFEKSKTLSTPQPKIQTIWCPEWSNIALPSSARKCKVQLEENTKNAFYDSKSDVSISHFLIF